MINNAHSAFSSHSVDYCGRNYRHVCLSLSVSLIETKPWTYEKVDVNTDDSLLCTHFTSFTRRIQADTRSQPLPNITMDYLTDILQGPACYSPYASYQSSFTPQPSNDLDALLASIGQPVAGPLYNQSPSLTLKCVPQIDYNDGQNTAVYQVSEQTPIDSILRQFGIDLHTLQPSGSSQNYFKTGYQPIELNSPSSFLPAPMSPSVFPHRRRMICQEISDTEDDDHRRHHLNRNYRDQHDYRDQRDYRDYRNDRIPAPLPLHQPPANLRNLLTRAWNGAVNASDRLPLQSSAPDLRPSWRDTGNTSPYMFRDDPNAVSSAWQRAKYATDPYADRYSPVFNRMGHPNDQIMPPPRQNFEPPQDYYGSRNAPPGMNLARQGSPPPLINLGRDSFGPSNPSFLGPSNPSPPYNSLQSGSSMVPPPSSLAGLLSQAYRKRSTF